MADAFCSFRVLVIMQVIADVQYATAGWRNDIIKLTKIFYKKLITPGG